jgi:hypothetical protein
MAVYTGDQGVTLSEQPIYGSARLGHYLTDRSIGQCKLVLKQFELSNHLGNVLSVISDI